MTDKELRRLSRSELLEMLLAAAKENERLKAELELAQAELGDRRIQIEKAGTLAEAALQLNGVFQAAQKAADQYIENIRQKEKDTDDKCRRLVEQTRARCEQALRNAGVQKRSQETKP